MWQVSVPFPLADKTNFESFVPPISVEQPKFSNTSAWPVGFAKSKWQIRTVFPLGVTTVCESVVVPLTGGRKTKSGDVSGAGDVSFSRTEPSP